MEKRVRLGLERILDDRFDAIRGQRAGLVCNQASVIPDTFTHAADVFFAHDAVDLTTLFGPQHGIRGDVQDNMIETEHAVDSRNGLPIYSLYSETREPTEKMLENVDVIVFDMQDVGCRIYTFIYTMANCMRAAKKYGKRDRNMRSAKSDKRYRRGRQRYRIRIHFIRWAIRITDAPWHDLRRARKNVQ